MDVLGLKAFDCLVKPVTKYQLLNMVSKAAKVKALEDNARRVNENNRRHREDLEKRLFRKTEDLQESEKRWQFVLDGNRDGLWDWNILTSKVFYSKRWKTMRGYKEDEISSDLSEWKKRVHPGDKAMVESDLSRHFSGETPYYENEHRALCKDGSHIWVLSRGKVISWTKDGRPRRIIGTHRHY